MSRPRNMAETGTRYVPLDWSGAVARCHVCGNPGPVRSNGTAECASCFIGGLAVAVDNGQMTEQVAVGTAMVAGTMYEVRRLRRELRDAAADRAAAGQG